MSALLCAACGDDAQDRTATGTLRVESRPDLPEGGIVTADGWTIELTDLTVSIREFQLGLLTLAGPTELDLVAGAAAPYGEGPLARGDYTGASFTIERARIAGTARRQGVEKRFDWAFEQPTHYVHCANQTTVSAGHVRELAIVVHPSALFRDSLVSGPSSLSFQAIADADADQNGAVVGDELWATPVGSHDVGDQTDLASLWEFIDALVKQLADVDDTARCDVAGP